MKKKILFQDTSFRDGFQSYFGARVFTEDFLPAVEAARQAGINHFEAGGGARFQSLFLYCGESAFDMMDRFREAAGPDAKLQTLARGINVVALSAQPRDMIDLHAKMFKKHGITHIRNFDALNDVRNLEYSAQCIRDAGLHHQVSVSMMELPPGLSGAHDSAFYIQKLKEILDSGLPFDSVVFKDASGTSNPAKIYETFRQARELLGNDVILWHHTHDTASIGVTQYKASIEAGADGICLARSPISSGTAQPDLMAMWHALKDTDYTLDIDIKKILEANAVLRDSLEDYFFPPEAMKTSPEVVLSPMPGGALTANTMMMRDTGTLHLYPQVIDAMGECVAKGGYGTSVTPVSQFYFQQAYANVTQGPWQKITEGYGNMVLGYFGKTPVPPDPEVVAIAEKQMGKPRFDGDPVDILEPGIPQARAILEKEGLPVTDENIFIVGALQTGQGNKGLDFLKGNYTVNVRKKSTGDETAQGTQGASVQPVQPAAPSPAEPETYRVTVQGQSYEVVVEPAGGQISQIQEKGKVKDLPQDGEVVKAKTPGNVVQLNVQSGDGIKEGDSLLVLEAMKMETEVKSPATGTVTAVYVQKGETVQSSQDLLVIS